MADDRSDYRAARAYGRVHLETASKPQLLNELFLRLLRDCADARSCVERADIAGKARAIHHALEVLTRLESSLSRDAEPTLVSRLSALYRAIGDRLVRASCRMEIGPIREIEREIQMIQGAFLELSQRAV